MCCQMKLLAPMFSQSMLLTLLTLQWKVRAKDDQNVLQTGTNCAAFLTQATVGSENTVAGIAATEHLVIDKLRSAQSHEEFSYALNELDSIAVGPDNFGSLFNVENGGILGRFLMVGPANSKDQLLLSKVLQFTTRAQPQQECFFTQQTFQATFCNVLAPLLDSIAQTGQEATLPEIQLCENIISFIKAFTGAHLKLLRQDSSTFSVTLAALVNATKLMFILDKAKSASQKQKLDCLECLVTFSCVEEFVSLVSGKVGTNMIRLLVAILSYYQQNNMTTDGGNSFTYKDRSTYRLAALSLRNISRCIIVPNDSFAPFLWGDHWLLENDINWLQLLLNDDERMIQKFGLGILGNLILIKDSYHHLVVKFPQFLDMAFSYLLDHERSEQLRGEAALIINNFLITFCHDNKIAAPDLISGGLDFLQQEVPSSSGVFSASIPSDLPSPRSHNYHDPIHTSSRPWSSSSLRHMPSEQREKLATAADAEEKIAELLGIFDHCGFFERLHSILDSDFGSSSYRCALSELLLNLTLLAPTFLSNALLLGPSGGAWSVLIEFFTVTLHASAVSVHARAASLEQTPLLRHFCCRQQYHCDEPILSRMRTVILHICRLAVQQTGRSTAQYFVQETRLLNRIQILFASALRSLKLWPFNIKEVLADNEWIQLTMLLLADLLPEMLQPHKIAPGTNSILVEFLNESAYTYSGSNPPGSCGAVIMSVIAATVTGKASCCLLSRLLSLHFGEVVCLPMDELLQHNFLLPRTATAAPVTVGEVLTQELLAFASGPTFDKNDPVFAESLRLSLQCLLGRCEFAKTIALECGIPTALVGWADELLSQVGSKQEAHFVQGELNFIFSTLRHLFAGSISAKLAGQSAGIFIVISALLDSAHFDDIVMLEAMHCLQNAIANCMPPTQLLEPVPRSAKHSLLSRVLKRWCRSNTLDDVQVAAMEVLKICVLYPEARAHLLKDGLMDSLMSMLPKAYKARSTSKVEGLLCLLRNATNKSDGQLAVLKKSGMLAVIVDLMPISSLSAKLQVLSVLKNVASAKESKSYFLSEENFIPRLCTIMVATETEDLQDATLHLVWMLIWDCERMKAAFKRSGLNDIIRKMTRKDSMSALLPRQESSSEISSTGVNSEDIGSIGRKEMGHSVSAQIRRASAAVSRLLLLE
ncbi:hypothetical protein DFJ73DRAFT_230265 [Zopfochytrium polystomum]|nr:hypothetical protein DFJ73DRAFT_230265 [Zopfochytrium polystomum]